MIKLEAHAGQHVEGFAADLIEAAKQHGSAEGVHNGALMVATPSSTVAELVAQWDRKQQEAAVAYRNSPEGQAAAAADEASVQAAQEKHDLLMQDLATLDFASDVAVLDWLCAFQDVSDNGSVAKSTGAVSGAFKAAGFAENANCGPNYKPDDRDNAFRYIVGQALDGLRTVAIHGIIHKFAADWRAKFVRG